VQASRPQDPYRAMLLGGSLPAAVVAVVAVVVFAVLDGGLGAAGAVTAALLVGVTFAASTLVLQKVRHLEPVIVLGIAMVGYMTVVLLLGLFLVLFKDATWLSPVAFAISACAVSLAWTAGQIWAFTRVRTLLFDQPDDQRSATDSTSPR
jgi:ATP synthase protein I